MRREMCSLHLTHSSGAVGSRHCGARGAVGGSVPCSRVHLCRGHFLPEPRFEPTTSGYKSNALSIRPRLPPLLLLFSGKTDQAAETVRPRELKLGQIVVVLLATSDPKARPNRTKGPLQCKKTKFSDILSVACTLFVVDWKVLHLAILW